MGLDSVYEGQRGLGLSSAVSRANSERVQTKKPSTDELVFMAYNYLNLKVNTLSVMHNGSDSKPELDRRLTYELRLEAIHNSSLLHKLSKKVKVVLNEKSVKASLYINGKRDIPKS